MGRAWAPSCGDARRCRNNELASAGALVPAADEVTDGWGVDARGGAVAAVGCGVNARVSIRMAVVAIERSAITADTGRAVALWPAVRVDLAVTRDTHVGMIRPVPPVIIRRAGADVVARAIGVREACVEGTLPGAAGREQ